MKKPHYLITLLVVTSCTIRTREAIYWDTDIHDYKVFSTYNLKENTLKYSFYEDKGK